MAPRVAKYSLAARDHQGGARQLVEAIEAWTGVLKDEKTVSNWIRMTARPDATQLLAMAAVTRLSIDQYVFGEETLTAMLLAHEQRFARIEEEMLRRGGFLFDDREPRAS